jgi:hypothetical protein
MCDDREFVPDTREADECGFEGWCIRRDFDLCVVKDQPIDDRPAPCCDDLEVTALPLVRRG